MLSEPHTLLDAVYLYNGGKIDECGYTNLVTNIIKVFIIIIIIFIIIIIILLNMSSSSGPRGRCPHLRQPGHHRHGGDQTHVQMHAADQDHQRQVHT